METFKRLNNSKNTRDINGLLLIIIIFERKKKLIDDN